MKVIPITMICTDKGILDVIRQINTTFEEHAILKNYRIIGSERHGVTFVTVGEITERKDDSE